MRKARFDKEYKSSFYNTLTRRVNAYFECTSGSSKANGLMLFKIVVFTVIFIGLYFLLVTNQFSTTMVIPAVLCFGISSALLGFNIAHDAVHGSLFHSSTLNKVFSYYFDIIGISSYVWKLKHNIIHHNYPNLQHADFDIEAAPFLRLSPADKLYRYHKYQHLYAPFVYLLFSLTLVFFSDIHIMMFMKRETIDGKPHPLSQKLIFITTKIAYLFLMLLLPMLLLPYDAYKVIAAFFLMHFVLSSILAYVLIPAHLFEQAVFAEKENGAVKEDWAIHQMKSTLDYSRKSRWCNFLLGGFNINVVHHLFPRICHVHLIAVSEIVKKTSDEFGLTYHETSIGKAILSHFRLLKQLGTYTNPFQVNNEHA